MRGEWTFTSSQKRVTGVLAAVVLALTLLSAAGQVAQHVLPDFVGLDRFARTFDVDEEGNIPALYSTLTVAACAFLLLLIARDARETDGRSSRRWTLMSAIFFGLAADEYLSLHEEIDVRLDLSGLTQFSWVVVGALFVIAFAIAFMPLLAGLPSSIRLRFLVAGAMYTSGTILLELVGGHYVSSWGAESPLYLLCTGVEELLEMAAIVVFIHTLLTYLAMRRGELGLSLRLRRDDRTACTAERARASDPEQRGSDVDHDDLRRTSTP